MRHDSDEGSDEDADTANGSSKSGTNEGPSDGGRKEVDCDASTDEDGDSVSSDVSDTEEHTEAPYSESDADSEVLRRRAELISDAKVFRVKMHRDGAGRVTYKDIYVPPTEEGKDRSGIVDPRIVKQQAMAERVMREQDGDDQAAALERKRERRRIRQAKKSEALWAMRERILATEDAVGGGGEGSGRPPLKLWQRKLRERWERPINEETGREIQDPPMVAALKARLRERRQAERDQQTEAAKEQAEAAEATDYAKAALVAAGSQYTYTGENEDGVAGEEQELYQVLVEEDRYGVSRD